MTFIVSHLSVSFEFDGSLQRKERFAYPLPALREALLNAVVHRDYANPSDIQIKIFDDRMTIFSPGMLYGGLSIEDLKTDTYPSHLRNKLIAEAFYLTKNIEKYGSGFIRIRNELKAYPKVSFNVEETGGGVMVTFSRRQGVSEGEKLGEKLGETRQTILDRLHRDPAVTIVKLADGLDLSTTAIEKQISILKEQGYLKRVGPAKGGHWKVLITPTDYES